MSKTLKRSHLMWLKHHLFQAVLYMLGLSACLALLLYNKSSFCPELLRFEIRHFYVISGTKKNKKQF